MILPSLTGYAERTGAIALNLEVAFLNVRGGQTEAFEEAFSRAQEIISTMPGYVSHQLQRCVEKPGKYLLLVQWNRIEDHTIGFRQSRQYQDWKNLLHHFYDRFQPSSTSRSYSRRGIIPNKLDNRRVSLGRSDPFGPASRLRVICPATRKPPI
jgi:heme-degrading monooxygenase HmoA